MLLQALQVVLPKNSAKIDEVDSHGATLLHYASALGLEEVIDYLSEAGCDMNLPTSGTNLTPILIAAYHGHRSAYRAL